MAHSAANRPASGFALCRHGIAHRLGHRADPRHHGGDGGGKQGLGFFILDEERSMNSRNMYAGIILVAGLGYALNRLFLGLEGKAMKWRRGMIARETVS